MQALLGLRSFVSSSFWCAAAARGCCYGPQSFPWHLGSSFCCTMLGEFGEAYSSRQVAAYVEQIERDNLQTRIRPVAVLDTRRDVEYGLGFYLDQRIERYERGEIPPVEHILVARAGEHGTIEKLIGPNRRLISFGSPFPDKASPQHLEVLWISSSGSPSR